MFTPRTRNRIWLTCLAIIGLFLTVQSVLWFGMSAAYQQLYQQSQQKLAQLALVIEQNLQQQEKLPQLIARHPLLPQTLMAPQNKQNITKLNQLLVDLISVTKSSDIYVINTSGNTIAASNYQSPSSFIGKNFAFRPYFLQAINGQAGRYYAVGVRSNKRGYYFSYPVKHQGLILGVIVVKANIASIEQQPNLMTNQQHFLVTAPDKVIFMSDNPKWQLRTLGQLSDSELQHIKASKRYANRPIEALNISPFHTWLFTPPDHSQLIRVQQQPNNAYLALSHNMQTLKWTLHLWTSLQSIDQQQSNLTLIASSSYLLALVFILFINERRKNIRQLRQSKQKLEQKVAQRTQDLQLANQQLQQEIEQRAAAQKALKETQQQLIQSEKLALIGKMSASINHELNQPLTALKSYSQNTQAFIARGQLEQANTNLTIMAGLVSRVSNIVGQFKNFARQTPQKQQLFDVGNCISSSITICTPLLHKANCKLNYAEPANKITITGDELQLEQVLVNLISNAVQAMEQQTHKQVTIELIQAENLQIKVSDNGPGVTKDNADKIFQPFYTTKDTIGLGLGLSISQQIIESMGGSLTIAANCQIGATFIITLPR